MAVSISISITQNSQSIAKNSSNVTVKVNYNWTGGSFNRDSTTKYCKINGVKYSFNDADINGSNTTSGSGTLFTKTLDIAHNSVGEASVDVYAYVDTNISSGVLTKSATKALTTIPRASTVSATSAYVGNNSTITISRKSSKFTHTLTYTFGELSGTIATKTDLTSITFPITEDFYAQIGAEATSKQGTITCTTYNGSTKIGTSTCKFTAKTNASSCAPLIDPVAKDINPVSLALTGDENKFIKGVSNASVEIGAQARNSATIKSVKIECGDNSITSSSGVFEEVNNATFTYTAVDSRGYSTTETLNKTLIDYSKLTCSFNADMTIEGVITFKVKGLFFNGSFGDIQNTLNIQYRYKSSSGEFSEWLDLSPVVSDNSYEAEGEITGLDYRLAYTLEVKANDKLLTITPEAKTVRAFPVYDWGENDFNFNVDCGLQNNLKITGTTTEGEKLNAFQPCNSNNNCVIGYGGYDNEIGATNVYGNDVNVLTKSDFSINDNDKVYSILGAMKALSTVYELECNVVADGERYSAGEATAFLIGGTCRVWMKCYRNTTTSSIGDINNEDVMTIEVVHNGKIASMYGTGFASANVGAPATFSASSETKDANTHTVNIIMCATAANDNSWSGYFNLPCTLDFKKFVEEDV